MIDGLVIVAGTIGPTIVAWIGYRENQDKAWIPAYVAFSLLGLAWGGIAIYNNVNETTLGSFTRAIGHFMSGALCGIVLAMTLTHGKSKKEKSTPPNQAL